MAISGSSFGSNVADEMGGRKNRVDFELLFPHRRHCALLFAAACAGGMVSAMCVGRMTNGRVQAAVIFVLAMWGGISTLWSP
jgi:hypothetical protein